MKKTLLSLACAALFCGTASAQLYEKYEGALLSNMSPDGKYVVEDNNGVITLMDREDGENWIFTDETGMVYYGFGLGTPLNNKGMLVGNNGAEAVYWLDGEMHVLPQPTGTDAGMNGANAISADGKYIVGDLAYDNVEFGGEDCMTYPVLWTLQDDGTYVCEKLPAPTKDFTGRNPQYVMANDISDDGSVIIGQVRDYTGRFCYPVVYKKNSKDEWEYTECTSLIIRSQEAINNLPEYPTEVSYPDVITYMTDSDKAAYNAAVTEYSDKYDQYTSGLIPWDSVPTYPTYAMFLTDNKAKWQADSIAYEEAADSYMDNWEAYQTALDAAVTGKSYSFNGLHLSRNGKYLAVSIVEEDPDSDPEFGGGSFYHPTVIDLTTDDLKHYISDENDSYATSITDDGTLVVASPVMEYTRQSGILKLGEKKSTSFADYLADRDPDALAFLKKNFTFDVTLYDYDDDYNLVTTVVPDSLVTGTVFVNPDGTKFVAYLEDQFSDDTDDGGIAFSKHRTATKQNASARRFAPVRKAMSLLGDDDAAVDGDDATYGDDDDASADVDSSLLSYYIELGKDPAASVHSAKADAAGKVISKEYYSVSGQRLSRIPANGVYLEKSVTANGATTAKRVK